MGDQKQASDNMEKWDICWDDVVVEDESLVSVNGVEASALKSKDLRKICSVLSIKGVKNKPKDAMVEAILTGLKNRAAYDAIALTMPRKTIHCGFRLLNIVFSDQFVERFARLGNVASRAELDTGKAANDELFWCDVQACFVDTEANDVGQLQFDDELFTDRSIDPSIVTEHDWKKLRSIWKKLNSGYKLALSKYTTSGQHEDEFYSFCNGQLDVFYLRKHLQLKPDVNGFVEADLPEDAFKNSSDRTSSCSSKSRKRKQQSEIADAICEYTSSSMQVELAKEKLRLMTKCDEREQQKEQREHEKEQRERVRDIERRWKETRDMIRDLRREIKEEKDDIAKAELEGDLQDLQAQKARLKSLLFHDLQ